MVSKRKKGGGCLRVLRTALLLLLLVAVAGGAWVWQRYSSFAGAPLHGIGAGATLVVAPGDTVPKLLHKLRAQGVGDGVDLEWRALAKKLDVAAHLKAGEYALQPGMSAEDLLRLLCSGKTVQYKFTLVEGWNIRQLRAALAQATPLKLQTAGLTDAELMAAIGHAGEHPEGRFLPETYVYSRGDSDIALLERAHAAMDKELVQAWAARTPDLPLQSPDDALILASLVEKETAAAEERPQIAGVFVRRLQIGMRLQTDPSVIYGIGAAYDGNIHRKDLETDTPYNTYTRDGLPPTPIAMPGRASLEAAVHPAPGDALYFVAVGDGSGHHVFSKTLAEHDAAVASYLREYRERNRNQPR